MEIQSYVFQSPYPTAVQVGRPDPQTVQSDENEAVETLSNTGNVPVQEAAPSEFQSTLSNVNVAVSSTDSGVSDSLDTFSSLSTQAQASEAYSS